MLQLDLETKLLSLSKKNPSQDKYAQYFTPERVCRLVLENINVFNVRVVADFAAGDGEFLSQAINKWPSCSLVGFDIDKRLANKCQTRFGKGHFFKKLDTIHSTLRTIRKFLSHNLIEAAPDVILSNPPYSTVKVRTLAKLLAHRLRTQKLIRGAKNESVRSEIAFTFRNLELLAENGFLAAILPEGIFSGTRNREFRRYIVDRYKIHSIISLPANTFTSCEANVSVIIAQKSASFERNSADTRLLSVDAEGTVIAETLINQHTLVERMDPGYHIGLGTLESKNSTFSTLGNYCTVNRGHGFYGVERTKIRKRTLIPYIHSTDLAEYNLKPLSIKSRISKKTALAYPRANVRRNDLLLVRVGKGCVGKTVLANIPTEVGFASDCLYVIKSQLDCFYVFLYLKTKFAKQYFETRRRGVCSKYLTIDDVASLPLYIPKLNELNRFCFEIRSGLSAIQRGRRAMGTFQINATVEKLDAVINDFRSSDV